MKSFPMFLRMDGRRVVICGGGEEAARKVRLILKTEAAIEIVADVLHPELAALVARGRARQLDQANAEAFAGAALVFVATGDEAEDARLAALARSAGAVVNVVDRPELCDAFTPCLVDRDPVVVAVGTEGTAPVLARLIKTEIEGLLDPRLGSFAALAGRLRNAVAAAIPRKARRAFWERALTGVAFARHRQGDEDGAAAMLKAAIAAGAPAAEGHVALVGAGPGACDLLTLRAVRRLQEADVIFYDRLVSEDVLELARRDSGRVCVAAAVRALARQQIGQLTAAEARQGRRVVWLEAGNPQDFGLAAEELATARADGIAVEVVPGVAGYPATKAMRQFGRLSHLGRPPVGQDGDECQALHALEAECRDASGWCEAAGGGEGEAVDHRGERIGAVLGGMG